MPSSGELLTIGQCATLACLMEVTAPKPGNVHRGADFEDVGFFEFAASAAVIAPAIDQATKHGLGTTVLDAVRATQTWAGSNTNLGTILLIAPLACVPRNLSLAEGISDVLASIDAADTAKVYEAIRLAQPGGLGEVPEADLSGPPPENLLVAMQLAADRDLVARQYVDGFERLLVPMQQWIADGLEQNWLLQDLVIHLFVRLLSEEPDSLIARKCGIDVARQATVLAQKCIEAGSPGEQNYHMLIGGLDFWLRCDGHRRNPGTTADMVAAALFIALREGTLHPPLQFANYQV